MRFEMDAKKFDLDLYCPECGRLIEAIPATEPVYRISAASDTHAYLVARCPRSSCGLIFVVYDRVNSRVHDVFPYSDVSASSFHRAIPESIREDFAEARRCEVARAYKGVGQTRDRIGLLGFRVPSPDSSIAVQFDLVPAMGETHEAGRYMNHFIEWGGITLRVQAWRLPGQSEEIVVFEG